MNSKMCMAVSGWNHQWHCIYVIPPPPSHTYTHTHTHTHTHTYTHAHNHTYDIVQFYVECSSEDDKFVALSNLYGVVSIGQAMVFCHVSSLPLSCRLWVLLCLHFGYDVHSYPVLRHHHPSHMHIVLSVLLTLSSHIALTTHHTICDRIWEKGP